MKQLLVAVGVLLLSSCGGRQQPSDKIRPFRAPEIPHMLVDQQDRAQYFTEHYWDRLDSRDTAFTANPERLKQAFLEFTRALPYAPRPEKGIAAMFDRAATDSVLFLHLVDLSEQILYDPNSEARNEELYIPFLRYIVASERLDEWEKVRPRALLELVSRNRPGAPATDFIYTTEQGGRRKETRLYALKAPYTLLYFNNPDCDDCARVKQVLSESAIFAEWQRRGLQILSIYLDSDLTIWRKTKYPKAWIKAFDAHDQMHGQQLYDLKAIPTLYLLDGEKRVLIKDAPVEFIEKWLDRLLQMSGN